MDIHSITGLEDAFQAIFQTLVPDNNPQGLSRAQTAVLQRVFVHLEFGQAALRRKDFAAALAFFEQPMPLLLGSGGGVQPVRRMEDEAYQSMHYTLRLNAMESCNGMASALAGLGRDEEAVDWAQELRVLVKNMEWTSAPKFDWFSVRPRDKRYFHELIQSHLTSSDLFLRLGNTAACVQHRWMAQKLVQISGTILVLADHAEVVPLVRADDYESVISLRHPDPHDVAHREVHHEGLQVRGSWRKIPLRKSVKIKPRFAFASFVWEENSRFYVLGGQGGHSGPYHRDFMYIDLGDLQSGWHTLPDYPHSVPEILCECKMAVYANKAYLFAGSNTLDVFDLVSEQWSTLETVFPVNRRERRNGGGANMLQLGSGYAMEIVDGKMYVFGGRSSDAPNGCSLFVVLDIESCTWRKLSGGVPGTPEWTAPGPRKYPLMWTDTQHERLMLMYGDADRDPDKDGELIESYAYDDMWSWDIRGEAWHRERICGNAPSTRMEAGVTFNTTLKKTIVFGGYSSTLPTYFAERKALHAFSYYGDTFVLEDTPKGRRWRHVITRGFPTYRAQPRLFSDPKSGRTFLFGGYTNPDFVRDGKRTIVRAFGDLWEFRLDVPGGHFAGVDLDEEARTARAGPWQRCFACGSAGRWKKCGGSCRGRAFFCDEECLKDGWREHKQRHGCTKQ